MEIAERFIWEVGEVKKASKLQWHIFFLPHNREMSNKTQSKHLLLKHVRKSSCVQAYTVSGIWWHVVTSVSENMTLQIADIHLI